MGHSAIDLLTQEWQWLVSECSSAMHAARSNGLTESEIEAEERRYTLRIDAVYARLKDAEARSSLMAGVR